MKRRKINYMLASGIAVLPLLVTVFIATPAQAKVENELVLDPIEGKLGDKIIVTGEGFDAGTYYYLYFSSDEAVIGNSIDGDVTHYELLERNIRTTEATDLFPGEFDTYFLVPDALGNGADVEDVHGGEYYVYVTYRTSKQILALAVLEVYGGEIEVVPETAAVGSGVTISGQGLRPDQSITIEYDGKQVNIESGDAKTDGDGQFTCAIVIPECPNGSYTVTAIDESGNRPETEVSIKPEITLIPTSQYVDKVVEVRGTGFGERENVTVTLDGKNMTTIPVTLHTNRLGSLGGDFIIPPYPIYTDGAIAEVRVRDESDHTAGAELTVLPIPAAISLSPATSQSSPGHVGMELTVGGIWFVANAPITITYDDAEPLTVATTEASDDRYFSVSFTVPPSAPGSHTVTVNDGINSVSSVFNMESEKPLTPVLLLPTVAATIDPEAYFDWRDVSDPSGIGYILQIGADSEFATVVLEKRELADSEYMLNEEEKLELVERETPYYWRVKAVDGTFSESEWAILGAFYVGGPPGASLPSWMRYLWIGLGSALAAFFIIRMRRRQVK